MSKNYFNRKFIITLLIQLGLISLFNYLVDPGNVYFKKDIFLEESDEIHKTFSESRFGIGWSGDERLFMSMLIDKSEKKECVAVGSSHIMQMSILAQNNLSKICKSFYNFGVSGAALEDLMIFIWKLEKLNKLPKHLFIEISPWILKWDMDMRYQFKNDILNEFLTEYKIEKPKFEGDIYFRTLLQNLISYDYTKTSWKYFKKYGIKTSFKDDLDVVDQDPQVGGTVFPVKLKDSSHVYSNKYKDNNSTDEMYDVPPKYKIMGHAYDDSAVEALKQMLLKLKQKTEVTLLLTPYHINSFVSKYERYYKQILKVENQVKEIGKATKIRVTGSYHPKDVECNSKEFFDYMHPKRSCVNKLINSLVDIGNN